MNMYGRAFESTFTGSMVGSGANVFSVWFYVCANMRTKDFSIELNPAILAALIGSPIEEIKRAIEFLCAPDPNSRSTEEEGRRIVKEGAFLYRVVNGKKYKEMRDEDERREYMRVYMQKVRDEEKAKVNKVNESKQLTDVSKCKPPLAQAVSSKHNAAAKANTSENPNLDDQSEINPFFVENANGSVSTEELFENLPENPPVAKKTASKPKKEKAVKKYKRGYDAVGIWCRLMTSYAKVGNPTVDGTEVGLLSAFRNWYTEYQYRCMVAAYAKDRGREAWSANYFYHARNALKCKIYTLPEYREDLEFGPDGNPIEGPLDQPPEKPAEINPSENQEKKS